MSKIFTNPLTPEQIKASQTVSQDKLREAQDALFMFLLNRIAELEAKISPAKLKTQAASKSDDEGKLHVKNLKK